MTPLFKKFLGMHWLITLVVGCLLAFGVYAIFNASGHKIGTDTEFKWRSQLIWAGFGSLFYFGAAMIDYKWVRWGCWPMYLGGIGGLVAVMLFGIEIGGNKAWLNVGGMSVQPSQFAIMAGILMLSVVVGDLPRVAPVFRRPWLRIMAAGVLAGVPALMVVKEDLGSGLVWGPVFIAILLVGSIPFRYLIVMLLGGLCVAPLAYIFVLKPYQQQRIVTTYYMATGQLDQVNLQGEGWDAKNLQMAVATGGIDGKGPMSKKVPDGSTIHRLFIPAGGIINDYLFSVIAEEFGFKGSFGLILGLTLLLLLGITVALSARDQLGRLITVGVVAMFFVHCFQNIGMNLVILPVIGIPIPLVSYGGTFVVVTLFLLGMVQSVWVHRNISPVKKARAGSSSRDLEDEDED